jgi:hypothetical protein
MINITETFEDAVEMVFTDLISLSKNDLRAKIEDHRDGYWARVLQSCGFFEYRGG